MFSICSTAALCVSKEPQNYDKCFRVSFSFLAYTLGVGWLLGWGAAVALVGSQMTEAAATLLAAVGRGPTVDPLVGVKVPQLFKAPAALWTRIRALTSVYPLVSLESREH